jgi:hypothetical protein
MWTQSLIGNVVFDGFPKKIRNKTFYFYTKFFLLLYCFLLSLALESISGVKSWLFDKKKSAQKQKTFLTTLNTIFSQKLSNYHISLWTKVFFSVLTIFFPIYIKVAYCCEGSPKKMWTQSLIGNVVFDGFPKKIRNKTFYFYTKKKYCFIVFFLVLALLNHPEYNF